MRENRRRRRRAEPSSARGLAHVPGDQLVPPSHPRHARSDDAWQACDRPWSASSTCSRRRRRPATWTLRDREHVRWGHAATAANEFALSHRAARSSRECIASRRWPHEERAERQGVRRRPETNTIARCAPPSATASAARSAEREPEVPRPPGPRPDYQRTTAPLAARGRPEGRDDANTAAAAGLEETSEDHHGHRRTKAHSPRKMRPQAKAQPLRGYRRATSALGIPARSCVSVLPSALAARRPSRAWPPRPSRRPPGAMPTLTTFTANAPTLRICQPAHPERGDGGEPAGGSELREIRPRDPRGGDDRAHGRVARVDHVALQTGRGEVVTFSRTAPNRASRERCHVV